MTRKQDAAPGGKRQQHPPGEPHAHPLPSPGQVLPVKARRPAKPHPPPRQAKGIQKPARAATPKGRRKGGNATAPSKINGMMREYEALRLRRMALDYQTIADQLGYADASGAYYAVQAALKMVPVANAHALRQEVNARLDAVVQYQWAALVKGSAVAANAIVRAEERRAKMMGIDLEQGAPTTLPVIMLVGPAGLRVLRSLEDIKDLGADELAQLAALQNMPEAKDIVLPPKAYEVNR